VCRWVPGLVRGRFPVEISCAVLHLSRMRGKPRGFVKTTSSFPDGSSSAAGQPRTIAVLIDYVDQLSWGYETQLRAGCERACVAQGLNLMFVVGRPVGGTGHGDSAHNQLYRLVHRDSIDGAVLASAVLANQCGVDGIARFCQGFEDIPLCSVGVEVPDVPSIVVDNGPGMQAMVEHFIVEHGRRRIAFIGGPEKNPDAAERLRIYRQVLATHGIAFDPALLVMGDFTIPSGSDAMREIIDRHVDFDAVIGANDGLALGAMDALAAAGRRVPHQVSVAGFDDIVISRFSNPPLTTSRQPTEEIGALAIQCVVDQIDGKQVAPLIRIPVRATIRHSCGCSLRETIGGSIGVPSDAASHRDFLQRNGQSLEDQIRDRINADSVVGLDTPRRLISALGEEFAGNPGAFLRAFEAILAKVGDDNEFHDQLQLVITMLRDECNAAGLRQLDDVWDAARCAAALENSRFQARQRFRNERTYQALLRCGERVSCASDLVNLRWTLVEELPLIPVETVCIALRVDDSLQDFVPFCHIRNGLLIEPLTGPIPASRVLGMNQVPDGWRHTTYVLPLTFESECLGTAVFEPEFGLGVCSMLCEQISFAIKSLELREEIVQKTILHERSVQERLAATERMQALSIMAGGVAHDLNSVLSPLVTLPGMVLRLLDELGVADRDDGLRLRRYIDVMRVAGLRATETIKDLMTLGRNEDADKSPLDLNWVVSCCLGAEPLLTIESERRRVDVRLDLYPSPLVILGTQHHVERAISNLLRNAVEATGDSGTISISSSCQHLMQPLHGYETVHAGNYAVVSISDTGRGIPAEWIGRIFEPFFTKKQLGHQSGSGLGLSIVLGVVKEHRGFVDVISRDGKGTTFSLYFPLSANLQEGSRDTFPSASTNQRQSSPAEDLGGHSSIS
jgi:phosphoserine phosphatase RsbU/P